jgi:hypothetical protein
MKFLQQYHEEGEALLQQSVTGDETWIHHHKPAGKCQSMERKHMSSPRMKKCGSVPSASKVMLTQFSDFSEPILKCYWDCGQAESSAQFCAMLEMLEEGLKHRVVPTNGIVLHHESAQPHRAPMTIKTI